MPVDNLKVALKVANRTWQHARDPESRHSVLLVIDGDRCAVLYDAPIPVDYFVARIRCRKRLRRLVHRCSQWHGKLLTPMAVAMEILRKYVNHQTSALQGLS